MLLVASEIAERIVSASGGDPDVSGKRSLPQVCRAATYRRRQQRATAARSINQREVSAGAACRQYRRIETALDKRLTFEYSLSGHSQWPAANAAR